MRIVGLLVAATALARVTAHVSAQRSWRPSAAHVRLQWLENGVMTNRSVTPRAPGERGFIPIEMEASGWSCGASYTVSDEDRVAVTTVRCSRDGTSVTVNEECVGQASENGALVEARDQAAPLSISLRCYPTR